MAFDSFPFAARPAAQPRPRLAIVCGLIASVLSSVVLPGCATQPLGSTSLRSGLSPRELLQEAGRICCDASTFEAVGTMRVRSQVQNQNETVRIRWVFGPDGEYRFERGPVTVVHDGERVAAIRPHPEESVAINTRAYQGRQGAHNRYPGDMVMATGMVAIGMTYPMAAARLLGKDWVDQFLLEDGATPELGGTECVSGHPCKWVIIRDSKKQSQMALAIDADLGVLRAWRTGGKQNYMSVQYDRIRVYPRLDSSEFSIPEKVRKVTDDGKD